KDPAKRYPGAAALADDLRRFGAGEPVRARRIGPAGRAWRWAKRNRAVAALLAAVLVTLSAGVAVSTFFALKAHEGEQAASARAHDAQEAEKKAAASAAESKRRAVRLYVEKGMRLADEGDLFGALPWLTEALAADAGDPEWEDVHRRRVGM